MTDAAVVDAEGVSKRYGREQALDNVNLKVRAGRIVGLIGPNGAGKTTLLKSILGLTNCEGSLEVLGRDPTSNRAQLMEDVCFIADVAVLPRWLRVRDAIEFVATMHPRFSREKAEHYLSKTKIQKKQRVKQLSKGMIVQLHLALIMAIDAKLLILDEPTLGLDILYRKAFYDNLLNDYFDGERTILITTHQVEEIEKILTDVIFIQDGRLVLDAEMEAVGERFTEVSVDKHQLEEARALSPITERQMMGRTTLLFDGVDRARLDALGTVSQPSIADLFVAVMGRGQ